MNTFKDKCIALRKQDHTLTEIVKITGRPKTSVYVHIHNIPLSPRRWKIIHAEQGAHIRAFALARKGKSERVFKRVSKWDTNLVFLASHFLFDGDLHGGSCNYHNRNDTLLQRVQDAMKKIYDFEPKRYQNPTTGVTRISYHNVALRIFFEEKSRQLLKEISTLSRELKRTFIQAFFDDEGCVDYRTHWNSRRIRGYQKNIGVLRIVQRLLRDFNIESRIQLPNEIVIAHKSNLVKFQKEINFSPGVRINGGRSNSIWKESLEKRDLLDRAIDSYRPLGSNGVHRR